MYEKRDLLTLANRRVASALNDIAVAHQHLGDLDLAFKGFTVCLCVCVCVCVYR